MNKDEKVMEIVKKKPGISRRQLAIDAGVGYATITKMVGNGQLVLNEGGVQFPEQVSNAPMELDIFESGFHRHVFDKYPGRKVLTIRPFVSTLSPTAFGAMDININAGDLCAFAVNKLDKSVYIGVLPPAASKKGYTIKQNERQGNYSVNSSKAVAQGVPEGVYEIIGKGREYAGGRWYPLQLIEK